MDNIYDNGTMLLGTKKNIINYVFNCDIDTEDKETWYDIFKDISNLSDNDVICIEYDNGMGYTIDYWQEEDKINKGV